MRSYFQIHFVISPVSLLHYGANVIWKAAIYSAAIIDKWRKFYVLLLLTYKHLLLFNSLGPWVCLYDTPENILCGWKVACCVFQLL